MRWGGTSTIKPICDGCGFVTLYVKVKVSSNLGPYGGSWCWPSAYNRLWAVGRDGEQESFLDDTGRKPRLEADILDCWAEGSRHEGWITIDTGRGFKLDHVELQLASIDSLARVYPTR